MIKFVNRLSVFKDLLHGFANDSQSAEIRVIEEKSIKGQGIDRLSVTQVATFPPSYFFILSIRFVQTASH